MGDEPQSAGATIVATFAESLRTSALGERVRVESIKEIAERVVAQWDGKKPAPALPLYEQLERVAGKELAAAAVLDLKAIAERSGVLVDLPAHLKALRLQERQELNALYRPRAAAPAAPVPAPTTEPAASEPPAPPAEAPRRKPLPRGVVPGAALALLVAYLIARVFLIGDDDGIDGPRWAPAAIGQDPAGLSCAAVRAAGAVIDCTIPRATLDAMPRAELDARLAVTKRAVTATGHKTLRVRSDDGVVRAVR